MPQHEKLNYLEFAARDLEASKAFFSKVFSWHFTDYGPDYTAFDNQGLEGGFYRADKCSTEAGGGVLPVFYSTDLEATLDRVKAGGGKITREIFTFPGGQRFQFTEPSGNELAVWSETPSQEN